MTEKEKKLASKEIGELLFPSPSYLDKQTKPIDVEKPINSFDYLNALVRIPEVKKDLDVVTKEPDNEEIKLELIKKYFGIDYFSPKLLQNTKVFYKYNKYFHNSSGIHVFSNWEKDWPDSIFKYRDGRHVILAVDITKKKQNITNEFKEIVDRIRKDYDIPKDTTKDKDTKEDIWEIYDYKTQDGLNFPKIVRKLSGKEGNPRLIGSRVKRVERAYNKAKGIINTVKQEVKEVVESNTKRKEADAEAKKLLNRMLEESKKRKASYCHRTITTGDTQERQFENELKKSICQTFKLTV